MRVLAGSVLALAVVVGCGGGSHGAGEADVRAYSELAQQISSAASTYGSAAAATSDVPSCQSGHAAYDAQVRPMVDRMRAMSGGMDSQMGMMGHTADGDMTCSSDAMLAELDRHHAVACTSTDMTEDHAEAGRHATAIEMWAEHQRQCTDNMGGMMGGTGGSSTTTTCHRNGDGTFTLAP
jgi:hypothetical protein